MTTNYRTLCAELADELAAETSYTKINGERITHETVARARAALAEPVPPNVCTALERLVELEDGKGPDPAIANAWTDAIAAARAACGQPASVVYPAPDPFEVGRLATFLAVGSDCGGGATLSSKQCRLILTILQPKPSRAALAHPKPPANGEVAELVAWMRNQFTIHTIAQTQWEKRFLRAADLLERLAVPEPVEPTVMEIIALSDEIEADGLGQVDLVRRALVRWGTPNLAQVRSSLGDGPSDAELLELMPQQFRDDLATVSRLAAHGTSPDVTPGIFRVSLNTGALDYARAVLARWGRQPAPDASAPCPPGG